MTNIIPPSPSPMPESAKAEFPTEILVPTPAAEPPLNPVKTSKWANLPPRDHPVRSRNPVKCYGVIATPDDTNFTTGSNSQHRAFVTFANKPRTYKKASNGPHSKEWEKAIDTEYQTLQNTSTFEWVPKLPEGRKSIGSWIIFRLKQDGDGNITKYKAHIIARGFLQISGQDFTNTFSSVTKFTTLRTLLSIITHKRWELHQVDVVAAYLQGDLDEELYLC